MAAHGYVRATGDLDIWLDATPHNADAVLRALDKFGAPLHDLTTQDLERDDTVFQIGVTPMRIDLLTGATGLEFEDAYRGAVQTTVDDIPLRILSLDDVIRNKRASGRVQDLADADALESLKGTND